jgi:hypothetical protein
MRVEHRRLLGGVNEDRRYPPRGIPNHMLPHGLRGVGVRSNALRNRLVEGASRQTDDQGKHDNSDERPAQRKPRAAQDVSFSRFLHRPRTNSAIIQAREADARLQKPPHVLQNGCNMPIKGWFSSTSGSQPHDPTRRIITSVALMRAAAVCPGFNRISRAELAVIIEVIC